MEMIEQFLYRLFQKAPNYMLAFVFCLMGTVFAAMNKNPNIDMLILFDVNVGLALLMAYWLDPNNK